MSRFVFNDLERPKRAARALQALLPAIDRASLSRCREIVADMLGFDDWHQLARIAESEPASAYDAASPQDVVRARATRQTEALLRAGVDGTIAAAIVERLHLTDVAPAHAPTYTPLEMDTPWWKAASYRPMPEGMMLVKAAHGSGVAVPKSLVDRMPALLRTRPDHTGHAWYEVGLEDCLVPLALPDIFDAATIARARQVAEERYPKLMQVMERRRTADAATMRQIRPHRIERPKKPGVDEFFHVHVKGLTLVGWLYGDQPFISAYRAGRSDSLGGGYLGATALLKTKSDHGASWGVHKYGHTSERNIELTGFTNADARRVHELFGIEWGREDGGPFYLSPAWEALKEWAAAHPKIMRHAQDGRHLAWVSNLAGVDQEWLESIREDRSDISWGIRVDDAEENASPSP